MSNHYVINLAKRQIVNTLKDLDLSIQMNCFTGKFEFVENDTRLDYSIWAAVDKTKNSITGEKS